MALLLLAPAVLGGCDDSPDVTAASPVERIVERGLPRAVEVSGRGQVLVSYVVNPEDDEGTYASSWRLYDTDGARVRDGAASASRAGARRPCSGPA